MEYHEFTGGLITNIAYHARGVASSARYLRNTRVDEQGFLVPRAGRIRVTGVENATAILAHRGFLFVVSDSRLLWGIAPTTIPDATTQIAVTFNEFAPARRITPEADRQIRFIAHEDYIFVQGGADPLTIRLPATGPPTPPTVTTFYLPKISTDMIQIGYGADGSDPTPPDYLPVEFVFQAVHVSEQEDLPQTQGDTDTPLPIFGTRTIIGEQSDPVTVQTAVILPSIASEEGDIRYVDPTNLPIRDVHVTPNPFNDFTTIVFTAESSVNLTIRVLEETADGGTGDVVSEIAEDQRFRTGEHRIQWYGQNTAGARLPYGNYFLQFRNNGNSFSYRVIHGTEILDVFGNPSEVPGPPYEPANVQLRVNTLPAGANYIDVFSSTGDRDRGFFHIARLPAIQGQTLNYQFPLPTQLTLNDTPLTFEAPDWQYFIANDFRAYAAEARSKRVYLSYYNPGTAEQLIGNFTDFIDLDLGDGYITGLQFIRDTYLVVYATNQIQVIATDPLPELHSIIDFIKPRNDKDELVGCTAPESIVNILGVHYFLAQNKHIYTFDGQRVQEITDRIFGIMQTIHIPEESDNGIINLQNAVGFAFDENYALSVPVPTFQIVDGVYQQNTILFYDMTHSIWWQDSFGISAVSKANYDRIYAIIDGDLFILYEGETDAGTPVRRIWRTHPHRERTNARLESVHVYALEPATIDVIASTEQGETRGQIQIENVAAIFDNRMGCFLRGSLHTVEIQTDSLAPIYRITTNEPLVENRA